MSQSDYIQYKRTQRILKEQSDLPKVLEQRVYTDAEQYAIETTIPNTKIRHSQLVPTNTKIVLDMERKMNSCPTFVLCKNTHARPNRVLNTAQFPMPTYRLNKNYQPRRCYIQKNQWVTRACICDNLTCKCGTQICEGNPVEPG